MTRLVTSRRRKSILLATPTIWNSPSALAMRRTASIAGLIPHNELGDHGIVERRDAVALLHARIDANVL